MKTNEMVAVPYSMDRKRILTTREQVEDMHQQIADRKGKRDIPQYTIELTDQAPQLDKAQFPSTFARRRDELSLPAAIAVCRSLSASRGGDSSRVSPFWSPHT
jgi:hypothetical protein